MRICSLLPSATEIAFALGLGDDLVGVTHECDYPAAAREKPVVVHSRIDPIRMNSNEIDRQATLHLRGGKSLYVIDEKQIREAAPDLILTQGLCDVCAVDYEEVEIICRSFSHRPTIISLAPTCLADILSDIDKIGQATGRNAESESLLQHLTRRIDHVRKKTSQLSLRPRVACLEWLDPLYYAGHWVPEMVDLAGGHDGLGSTGEPSAKLKWQDVVDCAPEIIMLMPCGFDIDRTLKEINSLRERPGWNTLPAVRSGAVYAVNANAFFSRPGPRLVDGLELLAHVINPEVFKNPQVAGAVRKVKI